MRGVRGIRCRCLKYVALTGSALIALKMRGPVSVAGAAGLLVAVGERENGCKGTDNVDSFFFLTPSARTEGE